MNRKIKKIIKLRPLSSIRFKTIYITTLILIVGLLARLINLQVFNALTLKNKAIAMQVKKTNVLKKRRPIVERKNKFSLFSS